MLIEIERWLPVLIDRLNAALPGRVRFVGLQGSYRRGEATEESDIDVVTVLDEAHTADLEVYRALVRAMPDGDKACGFLCGAAELRAWPKFDLLQLALDTKGYYGSLDELLPPFSPADAEEAVRAGASALYHAAVHCFLYEDDRTAALAGLRKSVHFLLRMRVYRDTGHYRLKRHELRPCLTEEELPLLSLAMGAQPLSDPSGDALAGHYERLLGYAGRLMAGIPL